MTHDGDSIEHTDQGQDERRRYNTLGVHHDEEFAIWHSPDWGSAVAWYREFIGQTVQQLDAGAQLDPAWRRELFGDLPSGRVRGAIDLVAALLQEELDVLQEYRREIALDPTVTKHDVSGTGGFWVDSFARRFPASLSPDFPGALKFCHAFVGEGLIAIAQDLADSDQPEADRTAALRGAAMLVDYLRSELGGLLLHAYGIYAPRNAREQKLRQSSRQAQGFPDSPYEEDDDAVTAVMEEAQRIIDATTTQDDNDVTP